MDPQVQLTLQRVGSSDLGTFGVLKKGNVPFCLTLERPWKNNEVNISCIPAGTYVCKRVMSPTHGNTFEVTNVPGRTHVLFHKGNYLKNTLGCILVGEKFSGGIQHPFVEDSSGAFNEFLHLMYGQDEFLLHVKESND